MSTKMKMADRSRSKHSMKLTSSPQKTKSRPVQSEKPSSYKRSFQQDPEEEADNASESEDEEDGGAELRPTKKPRTETEQPYVPKDQLRTVVGRGEPGLNSRESHAKQRQLAQDRKAAKPLADELQRTKKLWERLRRKSHVPKEERQEMVAELFEIITGRVKDFVLKHDSVRVVQTALKYSVMEQRRQITKELQGTYVTLAESRYAKFLIGKMLEQNDPQIRDMIIPEFYGKVKRLINHPEASWILDDIYRGVATKEQKAVLLREWYGPQFSLFTADTEKATTANLSEILEAEPEKRSLVLKNLMNMINQLIQKKMTGFTMLHDAMLQYFLATSADSEERKEFAEVVKNDETGDLLRNMAFTKSGARLSCLLLAGGNAKDRKTFLKTFKSHFQLLSGDTHGHMLILTAYDVIDDTVSTAKTIFPELLGSTDGSNVNNIVTYANSPYARTTIRYLFEGPSRSLFPASLASDLAIFEEIHEMRKTTSKKDPEVRREQLIAALSPLLLTAIATSPAPAELVKTPFGCQLVTDALIDAVGDKTEAMLAIANTAALPLSEIPEAVRSHRAKMYRTLIQGGRFDKASGAIKRGEHAPTEFANMLYAIVKDDLVTWATGPDSFVVVALLEAGEGFTQKDAVVAALRKSKKAITRAAEEDVVDDKAEKEKAVEQKGTKKAKGKNGLKREEVKAVLRVPGNAGARMILDKIS